MKKLSLSRVDLTALMAGIILPFAFAPFFISIIGFISPSLLLLAWNNSSPRVAAKQGLLFGLSFFTVGISWIYVSLHVYGQAPVLLAGFITLAFIIYLSSFFMVMGYALNRFCDKSLLLKNLLAFPALWVVFEFGRTWLFTGFPWVLLGYSQTNTWLRGFATLLSVYGVSFIAAFICGALVTIYQTRTANTLKWLLGSIFLIVFAAWGLTLPQWTKRSGSPLKITMIQGNIKQEAKWQPEQIQESLWLYGRYTQANWSSDLIIWPEAAITLPLSMAKEITEQLDVAAKQHHSTIITGIPVVEPGAAYNAMIALGMGSGIYYKRHLVPFGEYIPLRPVFNIFAKAMQIPMSDSIPGSQDQQPIKANGIYVAPYICYEVAYPDEFLAFLPKAEILLTITDDSWFGHSIAAAQHLQMAQMRAIETGRYLLFSSNTGITAVIDARGNIVKAIPTFKELALTAEVYPMQGSTPWMIWRLYPLLGLIVVCLALSFRPRQSFPRRRESIAGAASSMDSRLRGNDNITRE